MARGVKIAAAVRQAVLDDLKATLGTADGALRRVASRHGVSVSSVRKIRTDYGLMSAGEARTRTENGARQAAASNQERRAALAKRLLGVAERAIDDMTRPATIHSFGGKDNTHNSIVVDEPIFNDRRQLALIAAIALDKSLLIEKHDSEAGAASDFEKFQRWLTQGGEVP
jgi:hypothetical protein